MTILLLSFWSCIILFAALVNRKFKWTRPNTGVLSVFIGFGLMAPFAAAYFSTWLMRETPLHVDSPNIWTRMLTFFIAAGLGEELFKLSACILATMVLILLRAQLRPGIVVLGCVCVALVFAGIENSLGYLQIVDDLGMLKRSYLAVPLHASMGFIHGLCIDRSLRKSSVFPLVFAYAATVFFHTLYDIMDSLLVLALQSAGMEDVIPQLELPAEAVYGPIAFPLLIWMMWRWHKVSEIELMAQNQGDALG